ncbi:MAG: hypothetical protein ABR579_10625 [Actinomycetota bacterium]
MGLLVAAATVIGVPLIGLRPAAPQNRAIAASSPRMSALEAPYQGLATWVDMYNRGPWAHPSRTISRMSSHGVQTLYLETSSYRSHHAIYRRHSAARLITLAHASRIRVVAWSVPGFKNIQSDYTRIMKAITFTTPSGQTFDSYAMDIEATLVRDINRRNKRFAKLASKVRSTVGSVVLGAIVPDPAHQTFWKPFPYLTVDRLFDVYLPMSYFTVRGVHGLHKVHNYIVANVRFIKAASHNDSAQIHVIGGIAGDVSPRETRGMMTAARNMHAIGASLYDFPITTKKEWRKIQGARSLRAPAS